jgi:hypothetical protein
VAQPRCHDTVCCHRHCRRSLSNLFRSLELHERGLHDKVTKGQSQCAAAAPYIAGRRFATDGSLARGDHRWLGAQHRLRQGSTWQTHGHHCSVHEACASTPWNSRLQRRHVQLRWPQLPHSNRRPPAQPRPRACHYVKKAHYRHAFNVVTDWHNASVIRAYYRRVLDASVISTYYRRVL